MNKVNAVARREYLAIVKTKTFIIMTILMPFLMLIFMAIPVLMTMIRTGTTHIAIHDTSGLFVENKEKIERRNDIQITFVEGDIEVLKETFMYNFDALVHVPNFDLQYPGGIRLYAEKQIGMTSIRFLERQMEEIIEDARFVREGIDRALIDRLRARIRIESIVVTETGERTGDSVISLIVGYLAGFIMYFILFFYGSMIMRTVMEEKKNRIVEILVSSIRPFELMLGKIIGIAGVALTQLIIWGILGAIMFAFFTVGVVPYMEAQHANTEITAEMQNNFSFQLIEFVREPGAINLPGIFLLFMLYTVLGYLFYSTLFAAVGSLCDDDMQSQNFTLPITIPIILSLFIMFNVIDDPHTPLAFWASIIPFSSPVVMMARVAFHVPVWQVMLSVGLLIVFFVGSTWMAGKIYRMGILIYGKKFKWRDLWRFIRV